VLGVLSLIIYALLIVISIKYIAIVMRADNRGEGGILALTALVPARSSQGTERTIALLGVMWIVKEPVVLTAIHPGHAFAFFRTHGLHGFAVLGAVFLAVTGGEALYADMGYFGKRPIRLAWFSLVLPALLLNYFGAAAIFSMWYCATGSWTNPTCRKP
jgi:K+ transporter